MIIIETNLSAGQETLVTSQFWNEIKDLPHVKSIAVVEPLFLENYNEDGDAFFKLEK